MFKCCFACSGHGPGPEEEIAELEKYKESLKTELVAVAERIESMRKALEKDNR